MAIIGYWRLNGNSNDASGNGYNGTDTDMTYGAGKKDLAGIFNGTSSKITIPGSPFYFENTTFTVSICINKSTATTSVVCAMDGATGGWSIWVTSGGYLRGYTKKDYEKNCVLLTGAKSIINDGKWHSIIVIIKTDKSVVGNNTIKLYVDGNFEAELTADTNVYGTVSDKYFNIGCRDTAGGSYNAYYYSNSIDQLKIGNTEWAVSKIKNENAAIKGFF